MNEVIVYSVIGVLLIWNIVLTISFVKTKRKSRELFKGVDGKDLEQVLHLHMERVEKAVQQNIQIEKDFADFKEFSKQFLYKVGFKRFNPFQNTGGDQSFAIAILDHEDDGVVISSMHAREGTRIFAKPVSKGEESKYKFSQEELDVVSQAIKQ